MGPTKTPKPTKSTRPPKTPKPTVWKAPKTPKPTNPPKTKAPKTPKPTAWKAPKTPRPTYPPKTPRPTYPPKTPKPTATYISPQPTVTYVTPEPTDACPVLKCEDPCRGKCGANYECSTKPTTLMGGRCPGCDAFDSCEYVGWTGAKTPMTGCAENMMKNRCNRQSGCVWQEGYPPMEFSEDAEYQLLEEESFFAVDGSVIEMINNMDTNMLMASGVVFAAVLLLVIRQCSNKNKDFYETIADVDEEKQSLY